MEEDFIVSQIVYLSKDPLNPRLPELYDRLATLRQDQELKRYAETLVAEPSTPLITNPIPPLNSEVAAERPMKKSSFSIIHHVDIKNDLDLVGFHQLKEVCLTPLDRDDA